MAQRGRLARAGLLENASFNALVIVPNVVQGLFRRRSAAAKAAVASDLDGKAVTLLAGMSRRHDGGPVWVRAGLDEALLLLDPQDVARVLQGAPENYGSDPEAKRKGMVHFQPDALTISRGEDWRSRRRFTEAVLGDAGKLTARIELITAEEIERMISDSDGTLSWEPWNRAIQRIARRVILGDSAAGDWALTDTLERMMGGANNMPDKPSKDLPAFHARIEAYLERAEEGSLVSLFADAPADARTSPAGQVPHWMFALGDTLAINALRALALLSQRPEHVARARRDDGGAYLTACLQEAMRLWPSTPMLSRETLTDLAWTDEETVPAGTQVIIVNTYCHRDPDRVQFADAFAPEQWLAGDAADNPSFNHFSRGPQGCPGTTLALLVGRTVLRTALEHPLKLRYPSLREEKPLPHMLDYFAIKLAVG